MNRSNNLLFLFFLFFTINQVFGQEKTCELNLQDNTGKVRFGHLDFFGKSPNGTELGINSAYFEKDGKPWFPVMGEFHFTRYPERYWEEEILKMKSGGLSIIATYVFWNAHENPKGSWNWEGIRNLRRFVELCQKHEMFVWLRIGPWSHGEQLYGGHPEWIGNMKGKRSNDPEYLAESQKLFDQIGAQAKGMFFKDGGPIVGVQLENEFASGDINHIGTLKKMALKSGITPVYFSITANTVFHDELYEAIPLQGAYSYRGWEPEGGKATLDFLYANDQWIMGEALGKVYYDVKQYPKGLCEQGCGSQMTFKNRFTVEPHVVEAHLQNQIGRGMNLIGYYMFQGGTQLPALSEPGCPVSYDFQAPISEFGLLHPSYKYLKILHHFIRDFGSDLVKTDVIEPENPVRDETNTTDLRYVARAFGKSGFVFLCNTQVRIPMGDKIFRIKLNLPNETFTFPREAMQLKSETTAILPFNLDVNSVLLKYATAQPVARFTKEDVQYLFLTQIPGMDVELAFDALTVQSVSSDGWEKTTNENTIYLKQKAGSELNIVALNGQKSKLVVLTREQSENTWRTTIDGQETLIITKADLMFLDGQIELRQLTTRVFEFKLFPALKKPLTVDKRKLIATNDGLFSKYETNVPPFNEMIKMKKTGKDCISVHIPEELPDYLSDIFLDIDYLGSRAKASIRGQVMTDHLFHGPSWLFGMKRYMTSATSKEIKFEVEPWNSEITGVPQPIIKQVLEAGAQIRSVQVLPQYKVIINVSSN